MIHPDSPNHFIVFVLSFSIVSPMSVCGGGMGNLFGTRKEAGKDSLVVCCSLYTEVQEMTCVGVGDGLSLFIFQRKW